MFTSMDVSDSSLTSISYTNGLLGAARMVSCIEDRGVAERTENENSAAGKQLPE